MIGELAEPMQHGQCEFSSLMLKKRNELCVCFVLYCFFVWCLCELFDCILNCTNRTMDSKSSERRKVEEISIQLPPVPSPVPQRESLLSNKLNLRFNNLQLSEQELIQEKKLSFGSFVAREAVVDEEFWVGNHYPDRREKKILRMDILDVSNSCSQIDLCWFLLCYGTCGRQRHGFEQRVIWSIV